MEELLAQLIEVTGVAAAGMQFKKAPKINRPASVRAAQVKASGTRGLAGLRRAITERQGRATANEGGDG